MLHGGTVVLFAAGVVMGVVGFSPMFIAVVRAHRADSARKPGVGVGLASVVVSFVFLMAFEVVAWKLLDDEFLTACSGMVVGFFAAWALLAFKAMNRRF